MLLQSSFLQREEFTYPIQRMFDYLTMYELTLLSTVSRKWYYRTRESYKLTSKRLQLAEQVLRFVEQKSISQNHNKTIGER